MCTASARAAEAKPGRCREGRPLEHRLVGARETAPLAAAQRVRPQFPPADWLGSDGSGTGASRLGAAKKWAAARLANQPPEVTGYFRPRPGWATPWAFTVGVRIGHAGRVVVRAAPYWGPKSAASRAGPTGGGCQSTPWSGRCQAHAVAGSGEHCNLSLAISTDDVGGRVVQSRVADRTLSSSKSCTSQGRVHGLMLATSSDLRRPHV